MSTKRRKRHTPEQIVRKIRDADELLATEEFEDVAAARKLSAAWRDDYNYHRPHSSLGYLTPGEFAARFLRGR